MRKFLKDVGQTPVVVFIGKWGVRILTRIVIPALIFTWASFNVIYIPFISEGEEELITWPTYIKKEFNNNGSFYRANFFEQNFLIINTTTDLELTSTPYDKQRKNDPGTPITNRKKLARLLKDLAGIPEMYDFVVCDLGFYYNSMDAKSDNDLKKIIGQLQVRNKIIFSGDLTKEGQFRSNIFGNIESQNVGMVNKQSVDGYFIKHQLIDRKSGHKSLPLLMLERLWGGTSQLVSGNRVRYSDSSKSVTLYNHFIPELLFTRSDFDKMTSEYNYAGLDSNVAICDLSTAIREDDAHNLKSLLYKQQEQKKIIFVGAISHDHNDMHNTLYGMEDGAIILLNIFYNLHEGHNRYSSAKWVASFFVFSFIFYLIFFRTPKDKPRDFNFRRYLREMVLERIYWLILVLYTLFIYFFFHESTNLIALLIAIEIIRGVHSIARHYKLVQNEKVADH